MNWDKKGLNPQLIEKVAKELGYTNEQVTEVIESIYNSTCKAMQAEFHMVKITNFGKFIKLGTEYDPRIKKRKKFTPKEL